MNIVDVLNKIKNKEEITADDMQVIETFKPVDEQKLVDKIIAKERSRYDKDLSTLREELDLIKQEKEAATSKLTETEKLQKQMDLLSKKYQEKEQQLVEKDNLMKEFKKNSYLGNLKSKMKLADGYDAEYVDFVINKKIKDIDIDELPEHEENIIKEFVSSHPHLIKDEKAGTGLPPKNKNIVTQNKKFDLKDINNMSNKDVLANLNDIMAAIKE